MSTDSQAAWRILIVEDEALVAEEVRDRLLRLGYAVVGVADTGEKAIAVAEQTLPNMVLMDIRLKGAMSGIEAADHIYGRLNIPVVYTSAHSDQHTLRRAKTAAQFGYVIKPFQEKELVMAIEVARNRYSIEQHLRESQLTYDSILTSVSDGVVAIDTQFRVRFMNPSAEVFTGRCAKDALGLSFEQVVKLSDESTGAPVALPALLAAGESAKGADHTSHLLMIHRQRAASSVEVAVSAVHEADGAQIGAVIVLRNLVERRRIEAALRDMDGRLRSLYERAGIGIALTDTNGKYVECNRAFQQICGYSREELTCLDFWELMPEEYADQEFKQSELLARTGTYGPREIEFIRKDGTRIPLSFNGVVVHDGDGGSYVWSIVEDISERKSKDNLIWRQANFDALTGLPNRSLFRDRLEQEIKKAHRNGHRLALLFVDLDWFKEINDTLGHHKGDELLQIAAERIRHCIRETDTLARLGGDEFTIILPEITAPGSIEQIVQNILQSLNVPFQLGNDWGYISASIGVTIYPDDTHKLEDLLKYADQAMYLAKGQGRNRVAHFTRSIQKAVENKRELLYELREALPKKQLTVHYQPIVDLLDGRIVKAEALLRWTHPDKGEISPSEFIPIAEESGMIYEIGEWVFEQATAAIGRLRNSVGHLVQISVNKSPIQFTNKAKKIAWSEKLKALNLPGNSIAIEITEGVLIKDTPLVKERLIDYRNEGIEVSIDDFGTGFSSLSYLKEFDIDYLKIDRVFTNGLVTDPNDRAIAEAVIAMAHKLGLKTIAEGVETEGQRRILADFGCDYAQGYLFSRPLPIDAFEALLISERKRVI